MRFFFPDSQDQVDPHFNFLTEEHHVHRIRQRDDRYAHEVLTERPFDGLLISKAIVDGIGKGTGHYNNAARGRLYREHARRFFRLHEAHADVVIMGDCGAFSYVEEDDPPVTPADLINFYRHTELDWGVSPDHIVFGFVRVGTAVDVEAVTEWERRIEITVRNAAEFLDLHARENCTFAPIAVAHGWSAESYARSVERLQELGYQRIAMGGMVPLRTVDILATLKEVAGVKRPDVDLHLLGVTRPDEMQTFASLGVTSFDSTSPFRQAFKDATDNYYASDTTYVAVKVPQVDGNAALKRRISSGVVDQRAAQEGERNCLDLLRRYDRDEATCEEVLEALHDYSELAGLKPRDEEYRRTLGDRPWKSCRCGICEAVGIEVIIFRGSERNKRRGFHNLAAFRQWIAALGFASMRQTPDGA